MSSGSRTRPRRDSSDGPPKVRPPGPPCCRPRASSSGPKGSPTPRSTMWWPGPRSPRGRCTTTSAARRASSPPSTSNSSTTYRTGSSRSSSLPDPWQALAVGCNLWIDAHVDPAVQRIVLRDARAVLGWQAVREVENRFGVVPLRAVLRRAPRVGMLAPAPLRPLALIDHGRPDEACFYVADADDPVAGADGGPGPGPDAARGDRRGRAAVVRPPPQPTELPLDRPVWRPDQALRILESS